MMYHWIFRVIYDVFFSVYFCDGVFLSIQGDKDTPVKFLQHSKEAYDCVKLMLEEKEKAAVIDSTGTGKLFIGFRLYQEHPQIHFCWRSPSEYIFQFQIVNLEAASGK